MPVREGQDKDVLSSGFQKGEGGRNEQNCAPNKERAFLNYICETGSNLQNVPFDVTISFGIGTPMLIQGCLI